MNISEEEVIGWIYDKNLDDLKKGVYGKVISDNNDGTFTINDGTRHVEMKIEGNYVVFLNSYTRYPYEWEKALPIISIKDLRHEQLYFENRTQMSDTDGIFEQPNYYNVAKGRTAKLIYMTPIEYMGYVSKGFDSAIEEQMEHINKERTEQYANDMLKGDLFPMVSMEYYKGDFYQEGRHRAMAIQYLINTNEISEDTQIPVVVVVEE